MNTSKISRETAKETANADLCDALLTQHNAHIELVDALHDRIAILEKQRNGYLSRRSKCLDFIASRPELIKPYVEFLYAAIDEPGDDDCLTRADAIGEVRYFHDTLLDLSTLPCTGQDFRPWRD